MTLLGFFLQILFKFFIRSYGSVVSTIICITHPSRVEKFIATTTLAYINQEHTDALKMSRDLSFWPEKTLNPFVELYGHEGFLEMWGYFVEYFLGRAKTLTPEDQSKLVRQIKTPTLIFHGDKDFFVDFVS